MNTSLLIFLCIIIVVFIIPSFKDRTISLKKLIVMPAVFSYTAYTNMTKHYQFTEYAIVVTMVAGIIGIVLGLLMRAHAQVIADRENQLIHLKGSYNSLLIFIAIFAAHFAQGYTIAVAPQLLNHSTIGLCILAAMVATTCLSIGSNGALFLHYLRTHDCKDLTQSTKKS